MGYQPWLQEKNFDENAAQLGAFAVYLWRFGMNKRGEGNTYSTICGKLCAVRWYHKNSAGYDPGVNASHAILLRGIRRFTNPVTKQHPVSPAILLRIYSSLDLRRPRAQLLWGGILLGYFFLLRRSEYLHIDVKYHNYILRLRDIRLLNADQQPTNPRSAVMVSIRLSGAKNNQYGRMEERFHSRSGNPTLCPVKGARWVMKAASKLETLPGQPALSVGRQGGITSKEVTGTLKKAAIELGYEGSRYSTHSVRIGGATALLNAGADRLVLKLMGRWLSNAFEPYPVLTAEGSSHLASLMC